jgi:hypothetical protein
MTRIREFLAENQVLVMVAAVALVAFALWQAFAAMQSPGRVDLAPDTYFVELETGQLLVDSAARITPFKHDGNTAVRAHVYGCGECGGEHDKVLFYEKFDLTLKEAEALSEDQSPDAAIVYSMDGETWFGDQDPRYSQLWELPNEHCADKPGSRVKCKPD